MSEQEEIVEQLKQSLEESEKPSTKRAFRGFKVVLEANVEGLSLQQEVRYEKIDSKEVDLALKIVYKSKPTGKSVRYGYIGQYHKGYIAEDGTEVPESDVETFQVLPDGSEKPVEKFSRTKTLKILKTISTSKLDTFLVEDSYEIWADNIPALWKFAEWLDKNDKVAVSKFSFGNGFKESYALLYPHIEDGKFLLVMALTRINLNYKHLMPIITESVEQPKKNVAQTLTLDI